MNAATLPWRRETYEAGGWKDGRLGQAYDLINAVLTERDEKTLRHPLLTQIEELDAFDDDTEDSDRAFYATADGEDGRDSDDSEQVSA